MISNVVVEKDFFTKFAAVNLVRAKNIVICTSGPELMEEISKSTAKTRHLLQSILVTLLCD